MASARNWLKDPEASDRVVVVHCKAGKGRSGTVACSYLISEEGWTMDDALMRFTARRMRNGFGSGVSIPSQLRWIGYVNWWAKHRKVYVERQIEVLEVHVWGLRDGVKAAVEGYVDEGKTIKTFHTFSKDERMVMDYPSQGTAKPTTMSDHLNEKTLPLHETSAQSSATTNTDSSESAFEPGASAVIFRPAKPIILPTSDINIDFERRNKATYGFTMVTSVAHVWFNAYFESQHSSTKASDPETSPPDLPNPSDPHNPPDSGVFEIEWEAMDGIKGSARKGTRALDRLAVVWRALPDHPQTPRKVITQPKAGEPIPESKPADWKKANHETPSTLGKNLGLRTESPSSANISRANSEVDLKDHTTKPQEDDDNDSEAGVRPHGPEGEDHIPHIKNGDHPTISLTSPTSSPANKPLNFDGTAPEVDLGIEKMQSPAHSPGMVRDVGLGRVAGVVDQMRAARVGELPDAEQRVPGQIVREERGVGNG